MPVLDVAEFNFSEEHALGADKVARRVAVVRNESRRAVLHVGVKSPVPWLEVYPSEFALAPSEAQAVTAELRPERAGHAALAATQVSLFGQYLSVSAADAADLPGDLERVIAVTPPLSNCPHCAADSAGRGDRMPPLRGAHPALPGLRDAEHLACQRLPPQSDPCAANRKRLADVAGR